MALPYRVGLTGGIGSGKSVIAGMFSDLGVPVIDADIIAHELTAPGGPALQQISEAFGGMILDSSGHLKRNILRQMVFKDEVSRRSLESILHPLVYERMENLLVQIYAGYCILSIPLLLETNSEHRVDTILVVDTPVRLQIERVCKRDGLKPDEVEMIIRTQIARKDRINAADNMIINDGDLQHLAAQVNELHILYTQAARLLSDKPEL